MAGENEVKVLNEEQQKATSGFDVVCCICGKQFKKDFGVGWSDQIYSFSGRSKEKKKYIYFCEECKNKLNNMSDEEADKLLNEKLRYPKRVKLYYNPALGEWLYEYAILKLHWEFIGGYGKGGVHEYVEKYSKKSLIIEDYSIVDSPNLYDSINNTTIHPIKDWEEKVSKLKDGEWLCITTHQLSRNGTSAVFANNKKQFIATFFKYINWREIEGMKFKQHNIGDRIGELELLEG